MGWYPEMYDERKVKRKKKYIRYIISKNFIRIISLNFTDIYKNLFLDSFERSRQEKIQLKSNYARLNASSISYLRLWNIVSEKQKPLACEWNFQNSQCRLSVRKILYCK